LLRLAALTGRRRHLRIATHLAESEQEYDMFMNGRGEMFDWLRKSGREMSDCGLGSPVQHAERQRLLSENLIAAHVNYLGPADAELLGRRNVHVVHCPRSHAYFRHRSFPLDALTAAGVNICLGTDSLASVVTARRGKVELSMFEEMRELAGKRPSLSPQRILEMATVNGARALGMPGKVGELCRHACADLIAIPWTGKISSVYEEMVDHRGRVAAGMIEGRWVAPPPGTAATPEGRGHE
jgi:cytosine/adenosine deaminase-related metal-dependent hydrolase